MKRFKLLGIIVGIFAVVLIACFPMLMEDMDKSKIGINQIPISGTYEYWTNGGFQWQKFGNVSVYDKTSQIWFNEVKKDQDGNVSVDVSMENPAMAITYNDKGKGFVLGSVRVEMPLEQKYLERIQTHYGSQERLIKDLVKPTLGKVVISCGPLMSSLESVSEKRTDLIALITDQLNYGVYKTRVKTVETINPLTGEKQLQKVAEAISDSLAPNGVKRQEESPFAFYGLKVSQLSINDLEYESATLAQISKQREADMSIVTAKAKALEAVQKTIQIEEEGKASAAQAKWEQEKVKAVEVTKAQQAFEVAELQAKEANEKAKKIIAEGRAEAEANKLKVQAGLTPQAFFLIQRIGTLDIDMILHRLLEIVLEYRVNGLFDVLLRQDIAQVIQVGQHLSKDLIRQASGAVLVFIGVNIVDHLDIIVASPQQGIHFFASFAERFDIFFRMSGIP